MFITLYVKRHCLYCQQVRWVLEEKKLSYKLVELNPEKDQSTIEQLNPYGSLPIFKERDMILYDSLVIMNYIDERYPAPPLMPPYPVVRAKTRLAIYRIERDWYSMLNIMLQNTKHAESAKKALEDSFQTISPIFAESEFFMSDEMTLADISLTVLLWKLTELDVNLDKAVEVKNYSERMFAREAFKKSINPPKRGQIAD
jgi:RNA polymerase-associated protein